VVDSSHLGSLRGSFLVAEIGVLLGLSDEIKGDKRERTLKIMKSSRLTSPLRTLSPIVVKYSWIFSTTVSVASPERICCRTKLRGTDEQIIQGIRRRRELTSKHSSTEHNTLVASCLDP
jgi:hypothetical protein